MAGVQIIGSSDIQNAIKKHGKIIETETKNHISSTGMKIHDTTAGFVCYKRKVLESINLDKVKFVGYAFQIEMKFKAYLKRFKIVEIPVIFTDRTKGESKLSGGIISEAIFGVISMKLKSLLNQRTSLIPVIIATVKM